MESGASSLEKSRDLLFDLVLEQAEVFFFETGNEAIQRIGDRHIDLDQRGVDPDAPGTLLQHR